MIFSIYVFIAYSTFFFRRRIDNRKKICTLYVYIDNNDYYDTIVP